MLYQVKTVNGQKTKIPLSDPAPTGNPIGTIISTYKKIQPKNYLYCDGSFFDQDQYPALYLYLGSNQLPDYRECVQVGAEQNTTDTIAAHDVYTQGQFKDDQFQYHNHSLLNQNPSTGAESGYTVNSQGSGFYGNAFTRTSGSYGATGRSDSTTHGKQKAVYYYIKAVDGVDISDEDTFLNTVKDYVDDNLSAKQSLVLYGVGGTVTPITDFTPLSASGNVTIPVAKKYTIIAPIFYKITNTPTQSYQLLFFIKVDDEIIDCASMNTIDGYVSSTLVASMDLSEGQHSISIGARVSDNSKVVNISAPTYNVVYINII